MSRTGDVVWANGVTWQRDESTAYAAYAKNWWYSATQSYGAGSTLADLERHADFRWLVRDAQPVGGYDEGEAAMGSALSQHQIGFQSGREYERAAIFKWLNDPRNSRYLAERIERGEHLRGDDE